MRHFSTVELTQKIGTVTHAATREPVAITHHRRPRFVLMSMEDYERIMRRDDPRIAGMLETMSDDVFEKVEREYDRYHRDRDET